MRIFDENTERLLRQSLMDCERNSERLQVQLDQLIASNRDLSTLLLTAERRRGELLKLVVAFRRLVEASDAPTAIRAVEEIIVTIIGTENFVVLAAAAGARVYPVAGLGAVHDYAKSEPPQLGEVISSQGDRESRAAAQRWFGSDVVASIPLRIGENVVGAIVIAALLPHREPLGFQDEQVLCLLGDFAATTIIASEERRRWTQLLLPVS